MLPEPAKTNHLMFKLILKPIAACGLISIITTFKQPNSAYNW